MRRVGVQYTKPGMVLSQDVYDSYGNLIVPRGTRLTFDNVAALTNLANGEVFVQDSRVDDVTATSMIPTRLEGMASRQLKKFVEDSIIILREGSGRKVNFAELEKTIFAMISCLFPMYFGEVNVSGCYSIKDYDYIHPVQVASLAVVIGRQMGMNEDELIKLGLAAALQNIGYIALSQDMLNEPTKLTALELHEVQQHPQYGYLILKDNTSLPADIIETIYQHHERWNGKGYPRGLKREQIGLHARIIAVADVYYALVSRRPHRQSNLPNEAIEFIMAYSGEDFDPEIVKLFTRLVPLYPAGIMVKLNTGELGIITDAKPGLIGRPTIRICYDRDYKQISNPYDIDLAESQYQSKLVSEVIDY